MSKDVFAEFRERVSAVFDQFDEKDKDKETRIRKIEEILKTIIYYEEKDTQREARFMSLEGNIKDLIKSTTLIESTVKDIGTAEAESKKKIEGIVKNNNRLILGGCVIIGVLFNGKDSVELIKYLIKLIPFL